jgi:hypothetical protein
VSNKRKARPNRTDFEDEAVPIPPELQRQIAARHEAAHAAVAHAQGVPIHSVSILEREAYNPFEKVQRMGLHEHWLGTPLENARIAAAGQIQTFRDGERLGMTFIQLDGPGYPMPENDVVSSMRWFAVAAGGDEKKAKASVMELVTGNDELLIPLDKGIEAVAEALLSRGRLEEADVLSILGPYPDVSPETLADREFIREKCQGYASIPWQKLADDWVRRRSPKRAGER